MASTIPRIDSSKSISSEAESYKSAIEKNLLATDSSSYTSVNEQCLSTASSASYHTAVAGDTSSSSSMTGYETPIPPLDDETLSSHSSMSDLSHAETLEPNTEGNGIQDAILKTDGSGGQFLNIQGGGSLNPASHATVDAGLHYAYQEGRTVFKFAVTNMADVAAEVMQRNNLTAGDVAWLVPHQANKRIIDATAERAGLPEEKVMVNIHKYGNTTSATIPMCLWEWESKLKKGDNLILAAFGGGFTWGSIYLKWAY